MKNNQTIRNNVTGETLTMLVSDEENNGACQLYEVFLPPHRPSPPLHYHMDFTETFTVKQGKLDFYIDRDKKHLLLQPGESATAQIRQPHKFANDHDESVIFTIETKPAGGVVKGIPAGLRDIQRRRGRRRRFCRRCNCRKHLRWTAGGVQYRRSAKARTWAEAERQKQYLIEQISADNAPATPTVAPTIHSLVEAFVTSKQSQRIGDTRR